jgi:creatinine amidohydrolase/Fe(II)-dependent formamide hydrolase-like protein
VWGVTEGGAPIFETADTEIHAGEIETSTQLYLNPGWVKSDRHDYVPPVGREFLDYIFMAAISSEGVWGSPSYGDAQKGERAIKAQVQAITEFARQVWEL